ncbi:MAG: THUMP domain-containing class I SAM-dependent RNA methyltransferase [Christensenellales bacterium]|jgi:putative N6-adenine-specific DNA methylase
MEYLATTGYGLEGVTARELRDLGLEVGEVQTSRVSFFGDEEAACRANLFLRTAGRVRRVAGRFPAAAFDQLFEGVKALPWEEMIPRDGAFPVTARSVNSRLGALSACQRIVKKAMADRLTSAYRGHLAETGITVPVEVHLWKDMATLSVDLSGIPLHKRGYRELNPSAALRETLAAGMVLISHWSGDRSFLDPCCGSGTLAVEAAMLARDIAPGLGRRFGGEAFPWIPSSAWAAAREEAMDRVRFDLRLEITAADIDPEVLSMAGHHARKAGVSGDIRFMIRDLRDTPPEGRYGHIITNPPYGERLGERREAEALITALGRLRRSDPTRSIHVISPSLRFESLFGGKANHKRVLYNGPIACRFFQYFGEKPR